MKALLLVMLAAPFLALGALWLFQRSLIYPAPTARAPAIPGYTPVTLHTADGLALTALYRAALPGRSTIIFFHGNGDSLAGAAAAVAGPVAAGHGALLPEYRGYAGNPGRPGEAGLYADADAAHAFLRIQGFADDDIVIIGNSLGSGPATELATRARFAGLALVSGFTSLPAAARAALGNAPIARLVRDRFDNLSKLPRIAAPILVLHGRRDRVVGFSEGEALGAVPGVRFIAFDAGHELAYGHAAQAALTEWLERIATADNRLVANRGQ